MGKYHTVAQGECFSSLAHEHGFESYRVIYNHPENAEISKQRTNPNVLYPNDVVFIPDHELKEADAATEPRHLLVAGSNENVLTVTNYKVNFPKITR